MMEKYDHNCLTNLIKITMITVTCIITIWSVHYSSDLQPITCQIKTSNRKNMFHSTNKLFGMFLFEVVFYFYLCIRNRGHRVIKQ